MANDDHPRLCSSDRHVEALGIVREAYSSRGVRANQGDDHEVGLLTLSRVDGADDEFAVAVLG